MEYVKHQFTPTEYHTYAWKVAHTYNLQNDLIKEINFPKYYFKAKGNSNEGDFVASFYEDRARSWDGFYDNVPTALRKKAWESLSEEELLQMAQALHPDENVVGIRLVRFTNAMNGYPCNRLDVFGKAADTPPMEFGSNIEYNDCPLDGEYGEWGCHSAYDCFE